MCLVFIDPHSLLDITSPPSYTISGLLKYFSLHHSLSLLTAVSLLHLLETLESNGRSLPQSRHLSFWGLNVLWTRPSILLFYDCAIPWDLSIIFIQWTVGESEDREEVCTVSAIICQEPVTWLLYIYKESEKNSLWLGNWFSWLLCTMKRGCRNFWWTTQLFLLKDHHITLSEYKLINLKW